MALIKKIVLADEQIQMDANMVDAAQPLLDYMMQKSIGYISKQEKVSNSNSTNRQQHHTKPMSKKLLKQVIKPLMEIYLKEIPTEAQRLILSANKMVALNNGIKKMNATASGAAGGPMKYSEYFYLYACADYVHRTQETNFWDDDIWETCRHNPCSCGYCRFQLLYYWTNCCF